jgi:iron complex outermembrane receptor protein
MKQSLILLIFCLQFPVVVYAQETVIGGQVLDERGLPMPGCHVHYEDFCSVTDAKGLFSHKIDETDKVTLKFSFVGYGEVDRVINPQDEHFITIYLTPDNTCLEEINVEGSRADISSSKNHEVVTSDFLHQNFKGTFVNSIERLPGVNSMNIGANASKPVIRGMSLNRVVVSENGVKQEGQQWGADHGLEMDPFAIEQAEIVKGASGIEYGSEAIGGYINVTNTSVPQKYSLGGEALVLAKTVNNTYGGSVFLEGRADKNYFKFRASVLDFADYKVPADQVVYLTRKIPVYNSRLKNTAGEEEDFFLQIGRTSLKYKSMFVVSNVCQKSGFFPGAHGIPDVDRVLHDGDYRNISFPFQSAKHFKLMNKTKWFMHNGSIVLDAGYQDNRRQEWSMFHTHYPNQQPPKESENLELDFNLRTYTGNVKWEVATSEAMQFSMGIQTQWKNNEVNGFNFLLPQYQQSVIGIFMHNECRFSDNLIVNAGLRYDYSKVKTEAYYDSVLYRYLMLKNEEDIQAQSYAWRSTEVAKLFNDISWTFGVKATKGEYWVLQFNVGKAFRVPTAVELASNGMHHGSFRHEKGSSYLDSEKGYYIDSSIDWDNKLWGVQISPYAYYFSNYLFLKPTGRWSKLPHASQIYEYSQAEVVLSGLEFSCYRKWLNRIKLQCSLEYIYNYQLSRQRSLRYPLPFTPPLNGFAEADFKLLKDTHMFLNSRFAATQNRIAGNEEITKGYVIFGVGLSSKKKWGKRHVKVVLQANNVLNAKYYNHISFYRKIEIPEQGRNVQVLIKVPF